MNFAFLKIFFIIFRIYRYEDVLLFLAFYSPLSSVYLFICAREKSFHLIVSLFVLKIFYNSKPAISRIQTAKLHLQRSIVSLLKYLMLSDIKPCFHGSLRQLINQISQKAKPLVNKYQAAQLYFLFALVAD